MKKIFVILLTILVLNSVSFSVGEPHHGLIVFMHCNSKQGFVPGHDVATIIGQFVDFTYEEHCSNCQHPYGTSKFCKKCGKTRFHPGYDSKYGPSLSRKLYTYNPYHQDYLFRLLDGHRKSSECCPRSFQYKDEAFVLNDGLASQQQLIASKLSPVIMIQVSQGNDRAIAFNHNTGKPSCKCFKHTIIRESCSIS